MCSRSLGEGAEAKASITHDAGALQEDTAGYTSSTVRPHEQRGASSYPDLVVYQLASQVHLLDGASDGEDPGVGVGGGRRVPLQLHVSSRLLVNTLNGFPTYTATQTGRRFVHRGTFTHSRPGGFNVARAAVDSAGG